MVNQWFHLISIWSWISLKIKDLICLQLWDSSANSQKKPGYLYDAPQKETRLKEITFTHAYCGMANKATPFLSFILFISWHFITSSLSAFDFFPISFIACIGFHVLAPLLFYSCLFFHFTDNFSLKIMWLLLYTRICIYICMLFSFF